MTRALVVDDSYFMRTVISDLLEAGGIEVVGQAKNGREGVEQVESYEPDVVTMDVEMPEMNGIEAVAEIMHRRPTPILMLSALTTEGADATFDALAEGAVDVFAKPGGSISTALSARREELVSAVKTVAAATVDNCSVDHEQTTRESADSEPASGQRSETDATYVTNPTLIVGASTGGPRVVERILTDLPREADFRILVVQHMPDAFTSRFAARLDDASAYDVREASDGDRISGGEALVARGGHHMRVTAAHRGRLRVRLDQAEPVHSVRPAIDVTLDSVASVVDGPVTAVVLTGMGADGATGIERVKQAGGATLAQDEATSAVFGIPARAIETGCVDRVLPADELTDGILTTVRNT